MKSDVSTKLSTDTAFFSDLISEIRKGEIKVPQFQRKFVWKDEQALDLLDSVANRYPIGSILLWKTKDKLNAERNIGNFKLPKTDDLTPTNYVLDGQQRMTVIYSCLGAPESGEGFSAGYDLEKECFVELKTKHPSPEIFPLRKIFSTTSLLNYRTSILSLANSELLQDRLDDLVAAFTQYKLPVVTLKDLTIEEVCPIFERINSSGTKLSTYDLMVAATWAEDFDLNDKVNGILRALESKGYGNTSQATILKAISAIELESIQDKSLRTLRDLPTTTIDSLVERAQQAMLSAVDILSTQFGILSWDFLSYEAVLVIATYIFRDTHQLTADQAARLKQWFWRSSLGERYKVGGENFVSRDMVSVSKFVLFDEGDPEDFGRIPLAKDWADSLFRSNVARSRAFILALAAKRPNNLSNGLSIDVSYALSAYNKKEYHHFYPRAYLKGIGKGKISNVLGNIIMLTSSTNKAISDKAPSHYVPELVEKLGGNADKVFSSNLLPVPSEFSYIKASYEDFLALRGRILSDFVESELAP